MTARDDRGLLRPPLRNLLENTRVAGVPAADRERIFEPFYRAKSAARGSGFTVKLPRRA